VGEKSYAPSDDILARDVGDEVVLLQLSTEKYFGLTGSAAAMWSALVEGGTVSAAHPIVAGRFDADPAVIRTDLEHFADELAERGLLQIRTS
jgi:hypothetical protein